LARFLQGVAAYEDMGFGSHLLPIRTTQGEVYGTVGQVAKGLSVLSEALELADKTGETMWKAEAYRTQGDLLLMQRDDAAAEASFLRAIEVARQQQARFWELRATVSLCRLWQGQGRRQEARRVLAAIYGWFTEGFDTPDLQDAEALLSSL
jgi:predicted ATPase